MGQLLEQEPEMLVTLNELLGRQWTAQDELLASLIEIVDQGNRVLIQVNSKKGAIKPKPIRVPRPHDKERRRRHSTPEEVRAFLGR